MEDIVAETRTNIGTGCARAIRSRNKIPCVIYGPNKTNLHISVCASKIKKLYKSYNFSTLVFNIKLNDKDYHVLPKAIDFHKITDEIIHIDFIYLNSDSQKVSVPLVFEGKDNCLGVKRGGFFNIIKRKIDLICLVKAIPSKIDINVSNMVIGDKLKIFDIFIPEKCSLVDKKNIIIASVIGRGGKDEVSDNATSVEESANNKLPKK